MYAFISDTHTEQFLVEQLWAIESLEDGLALRVSGQEVRCSDESVGTEVWAQQEVGKRRDDRKTQKEGVGDGWQMAMGERRDSMRKRRVASVSSIAISLMLHVDSIKFDSDQVEWRMREGLTMKVRRDLGEERRIIQLGKDHHQDLFWQAIHLWLGLSLHS